MCCFRASKFAPEGQFRLYEAVRTNTSRTLSYDIAELKPCLFLYFKMSMTQVDCHKSRPRDRAVLTYLELMSDKEANDKPLSSLVNTLPITKKNNYGSHRGTQRMYLCCLCTSKFAREGQFRLQLASFLRTNRRD